MQDIKKTVDEILAVIVKAIVVVPKPETKVTK